MKSDNRCIEDMAIDNIYSIEFRISASMVEKFSTLTGDFSSLHTDKEFGRRSIYRKNVVHGMLPITFISALNYCHASDESWLVHRLSAKFLKPAFMDDRLSLGAKVIGRNMGGKQTELEFVLKNTTTSSTLTTGYLTLVHASPGLNHKNTQEHVLTNAEACMVKDSLVEQDLRMSDILKDEEKSFAFRLSKKHAHLLYRILSDGLSQANQFDCSAWLMKLNILNLLASCLFSTFVGMCIPGKYGTFLDFIAEFREPIVFSKEYVFSGKVGYKSASTSTVVENISILDTKSDQLVCGSGKITAKVGDPPAKMPSVKFLESTELDLELKDKVVLITGASRGIGETTAKLFSLYGAKVVINYLEGKREASEIVEEIISSGGEAIAIRADVGDRRQVKKMVKDVVERYDTLHILVNNAVRDANPIEFLELNWEEVEKDFNVILKGAFNCCQEVIPLMVRNGKGKIVNICTSYVDSPPRGQAKYVIAKSALVGLTRSLAVEFAHHNIQVNAVSPSIVETDLTGHVSKIFLEGMKNDTPMKRNASPVDVGKAVIFLASSLASFTTGQKFMVTGGNLPFL